MLHRPIRFLRHFEQWLRRPARWGQHRYSRRPPHFLLTRSPMTWRPLSRLISPCCSHSDVRLHHRARSRVGGWSKGGQEGQALGRSRGGFSTKIHAKSDASGDIIAFDLTGGEAFDGRHFETLLDIGPDIQPRAVISRQRLRQQGQPGRRESARHRSGHPAQDERKQQASLLRPHPLQGPRPHRAGRRTAQALQAGRAPMRNDRTKLQINRQLRRRPLLDQIRPHGLMRGHVQKAGSLRATGRPGPIYLAYASDPGPSRNGRDDGQPAANHRLARDPVDELRPDNRAGAIDVTLPREVRARSK